MAEVNVIELDLYDILGVDQLSTTQDIKKAYRKKALTCHPDKNPDDKKAAEKFHTLSKALEILIDVSARAAYDKVLNAKKEAKARNQKLDARRKKLKEDLEAKEQASMKTAPTVILQQSFSKPKSDEEKLKAEIERLRKQGSKELEEEIEIVRQQVEKEWILPNNSTQNRTSNISHANICRIRVRWKNEDGNSLYTEEIIRNIFSKYGSIAAVVISSKNVGKSNSKGVGIVEFENPASAERALLETGFSDNLLKVESLIPKSQSEEKKDPPKNSKSSTAGEKAFEGNVQFPSTATTFPSFFDSTKNSSLSNDFQSLSGGSGSVSMTEHLDFESLVLRRMRQAQERRRLEEEIRSQEKDDG
ncbi:hypothetical protein J437_LFUL003919 [Ladona fulva]|uniref:DnaJ homolog subfamily C member 17 n=1 Tax=Ladona fulva TaxID=123851 RepID=A0A8K0P2B8_LADFU|nr:hypothetical protein J437_LFUL003919 [Ladona fulva]